jgi:hypothetical protein
VRVRVAGVSNIILEKLSRLPLCHVKYQPSVHEPEGHRLSLAPACAGSYGFALRACPSASPSSRSSMVRNVNVSPHLLAPH